MPRTYTYAKRRPYSSYGKSYAKKWTTAKPYVPKKKYTAKPAYRKKQDASDDSAMKELAVYINPYSVATQQPRIPDGSRNHSLGVSFRAHFLSAGTGQKYIFLFAGKNCFGGTGSLTAMDAFATPPTYAAGDSSMEAWRGVSFGMKVRNTNATDANGGSWSAIRLRSCEFQVTESQLTIPSATGVNSLGNWANDPSFSSGRLRDIDKQDFILATENDEHLWVDNDPIDAKNRQDRSFDIICLQVSEGANIMIDFFANYEKTFRATSEVNMYQLKSHHVLPSVMASAQIAKRALCNRAAS